MPSKTEQILDAITASLVTAGLPVERNSAVPNAVEQSGLVIVRDGTPGEPERLLGGFTSSYYRHEVEVELMVQNPIDANRDTLFDTLLSGVRNALYADPTFGGLIFGIEPSLPAVVTIPVEGGVAIKAGTITLAIEYDLSNPLG